MELNEFEIAVVKNDAPSIMRMLDDDPGLVNRAGYKGLPVIDLAVSRSNATVVEFLLERGAVINRVDDVFGSTPLHQTVARDRKEIVVLLLKLGADSALKDREGKTAYDLAVSLRRSELAEMLRVAADHTSQKTSNEMH
jgi:ankyrin repeat protein